MVTSAMKTYTVTYERDDEGWWVASVREVRGCHTQGRTLGEARRRIRQALSLFVDEAKRARQAVRVLTRQLRLSVRDAGELLGLSHQRVQQLAQRRAG